MGEPFTHHLRVRYAECDPQNVVFNANYLAYFDASLTELWRAAFGSYQAMLDRGVDVVVAEAQVRFRGPARFDDLLALSIAVIQLGNTSIVSEHLVTRDGEVIAPSADQPIATIGNLEHLRVRAEFEERDLGKVRDGQIAVVRSDAFQGRDFDGKV